MLWHTCPPCCRRWSLEDPKRHLRPCRRASESVCVWWLLDRAIVWLWEMLKARKACMSQMKSKYSRQQGWGRRDTALFRARSPCCRWPFSDARFHQLDHRYWSWLWMLSANGELSVLLLQVLSGNFAPIWPRWAPCQSRTRLPSQEGNYELSGFLCTKGRTPNTPKGSSEPSPSLGHEHLNH